MVKCTVAIPVYNRAKVLRRTIDSVLDQGIQNCEVLAVDDCSYENVFEILDSYPEAWVRVVRNERNLGLFGNFNRCLELARGEYVKILCNDDRLIPGSLQREIDIMDANHDVVLTFGAATRVDPFGNTLGAVGNHFAPGIYLGDDAIFGILWFNALYAINPVPLPSGVLVKKSSLAEVGLFDTRMKMYGDMDLWLRLLCRGNMAVLPTQGAEITVHPEQMSAMLRGNADVIKEVFLMTDKYKDRLVCRGVQGRIYHQLSAMVFGLSCALWWKGMREESREYWGVLRERQTGALALAVSTMRLAVLRGLLKGLGKRFLPIKPFRGLGPV